MLVSPMSVLERVAERMTDYELGYEFELNSKQVCLSAFNFALATISQFTPQAFTLPMKVALPQGERHKIGECDRVLSMGDVYVNNEYVSTPDDIEKLNNKLRKLPQCNPAFPMNKSYKMQYMGLEGLDIVKVYPPIPPDVSVQLEILCGCTPQADSYESAVEVPASLVVVVEEFMLYYLYDIDAESVPNRARSSLHWQIATSVLGVSKNVPQLQRAEE